MENATADALNWIIRVPIGKIKEQKEQTVISKLYGLFHKYSLLQEEHMSILDDVMNVEETNYLLALERQITDVLAEVDMIKTEILLNSTQLALIVSMAVTVAEMNKKAIFYREEASKIEYSIELLLKG